MRLPAPAVFAAAPADFSHAVANPNARTPAPTSREIRRSVRVVLLIIATVAMSMGDLYMTLAYLRTIGMVELNPLARLVIEYDCPWLLFVWKALTLSLGMGILFRLRRTRHGEIGAWVCFAVLFALTIHWVNYNRSIAEITPAVASLAASGDPAWVTISD